MDVGDRVHPHPSPVRQPATTETAHLVSQEFDRALVNSVIVRFQDSELASVDELHEALLLDSSAEQSVPSHGTFHTKPSGSIFPQHSACFGFEVDLIEAAAGPVGMWESQKRFPRAVERVENLPLVFQAFHGPAFP